MRICVPCSLYACSGVKCARDPTGGIAQCDRSNDVWNPTILLHLRSPRIIDEIHGSSPAPDGSLMTGSQLIQRDMESVATSKITASAPTTVDADRGWLAQCRYRKT